MADGQATGPGQEAGRSGGGAVLLLDRPVDPCRPSASAHLGRVPTSIARTAHPAAGRVPAFTTPVPTAAATPTTVELLPFAARSHPLRSPALVLLAAVAIVEGYSHLGVFTAGGSSAWLVDVASSLVFSVLASVSALALTRPPLSGCRRRAEAILVATAVLVVAATLASLALGPTGGVAGRVTGVADLVFALVAALVVAGNERRRAA